MENQFKRMQFLAGIVTESIINEESEPDFSGLSQVNNIIDAELKKDQPVDEIVGLTVAAFILALPGIINGIARIIKAIKDKAPPRFNLSKNDNQSHLDYIIKFTGKIDGYLDGPFKSILTPFLTLIIMSMGTDITKSPDIMAIGKELTPSWTDIVSSPNLASLITKAKTIIPQLLT